MPLPAIPFLMKGLAFLKDPKILIIIVVLGVVAYSAKATVENIQDASFSAGQAAERAVWIDKERKERLAYDAELKRLTELVNTTEAELEAKLVAIEENAKEELAEVLNEQKVTIAKLRTGNLRLSIDLRHTAAQAATAELAGATAVRHATYRAELSEAASEFLIGLAADADRTAVMLTQCQTTVTTYLEAVEEYNRKYSTYTF